MATIYSTYTSTVSATTDSISSYSANTPDALRLFLLQPTVVFAGRVNLASATYPLQEIPFDGVTTGAYGDIVSGMTIVLGSSAGASDYGRQRIRKAATSTTIYVGRSSQGVNFGELNVQDNAYITVLDLREVWAKIQQVTTTPPPNGTIYKDGDVAYGEHTIYPPPVANTGPGFAGTIDPSTGLVTVQFNGTGSFATADGASISTYTWDVQDGTITVGTSASNTITATFSAGFRYVSLIVADSNGKSHKAYCPVYARDPDADTTIQHWQMTSHRITQEGQKISVKVLDDIPASTYPECTLAMIWEGEPSSSSDRTHLVFVGWVDTEPAQISANKTATLKDTTLNLLDVAGRLSLLPGFGISVENVDDASDVDTWAKMPDLNMDKYLHYIFQWHSNVLDVADWLWTGTTTTFPTWVQASIASNLWDQARLKAKALTPDYILTCNTYGQMLTKADQILVDFGSRTSTTQATLDAGDFSDLRYTRQRAPRLHSIREGAVQAVGADPVSYFAKAPGLVAVGQGESFQEEVHKLSRSQSDTNVCAGHRYARLNAPNSHFTIELLGSDDLDIEPANVTWVKLTVPSDVAAQRGLSFTEARGLVHEINIRYDYQRTGLVKTIELDWEMETASIAPAVTEEQPDPATIPTPEVELPPDVYTPLPSETPSGGTGLKTVYVMSGKKLKRTNDFYNTSPTWTDITPGGLTSGNPLYDFILDPWNPSTTGYLAGRDGVFKSTNLDATTPTWTNVYSDSDIVSDVGESIAVNGWGKLLGSPNLNGWVCFTYGFDTHTQVVAATTFDAGSSWGVNPIIASGAAFKATTPGCVDVVPHTVGGSLKLYMADGQSDKLYKSDDAGVTWTLVGSIMPNMGYTRCLSIPLDDNASGDTFYVTCTTHSTDDGFVLKTTNGGTGFSDVSQVAGYGSGPKRGGIESYTGDKNRLYYWSERLSNEIERLWISTDEGSTWTEATCTGLGLAANEWVMAASGFPYNNGQLYCLTNKHVYLSTDSGENWTDKSGDIALNSSGLDFEYVEKYGNGCVVACWVE